jgi:flagellar hook-associated protein FlgK
MMTMLETQRAYQASARFVGVIDEMLAETLQMVG